MLVNSSQQQAIDTFIRTQKEYEVAEEELEKAFRGFRPLMKAGKYDEAREFLRPMPQCAAKVLAFREIILAETYKSGQSAVKL